MKIAAVMFLCAARACSVETSETDPGPGDTIEVRAELSIPARGSHETGAGINAPCLAGYVLADGWCEASEGVAVLGSAENDNGWGCGVRNDGPTMGKVTAYAVCERAP